MPQIGGIASDAKVYARRNLGRVAGEMITGTNAATADRASRAGHLAGGGMPALRQAISTVTASPALPRRKSGP